MRDSQGGRYYSPQNKSLQEKFAIVILLLFSQVKRRLFTRRNRNNLPIKIFKAICKAF